MKQPLDTGALAEIRARLPDETRAQPRPLVLSVAVAIVLFLCGGAVVMSATLLGHWSPFRGAPADAPAAVMPAPPHHARVAPVAEPVADPAPVRPLKVVRRAEAPVEDAPAAPDRAPPVAAEPPRPSAIAREAAVLGAALQKLRDEGDAAGALALLDAHDAEFAATGLLADEAGTTRVEALLRLGQRARALALLDARVLPPSGRARALLASRGELRADAGRGAEARADFDALLSDDALDDDVIERALFGRAACRARAGDANGARSDLDAYLARFPDGRYATRARASLGR
ncbi:MAG TPA: hypothetical protein VH560_14745 [Polyangia bacterium]|nr:hypothetical protein [Polyangia bacterium]